MKMIEISVYEYGTAAAIAWGTLPADQNSPDLIEWSTPLPAWYVDLEELIYNNLDGSYPHRSLTWNGSGLDDCDGSIELDLFDDDE